VKAIALVLTYLRGSALSAAKIFTSGGSLSPLGFQMRLVMTREEITSFLKQHKGEMALRFGVQKIGLFGSYARGEAREDSDIDITVELKGDNLADNFFGVLHFLEDNLQHKIDLGIESNIRPEIRAKVMKEIIYV
jgi:uncharacterized protein